MFAVRQPRLLSIVASVSVSSGTGTPIAVIPSAEG